MSLAMDEAYRDYNEAKKERDSLTDKLASAEEHVTSLEETNEGLRAATVALNEKVTVMARANGEADDKLVAAEERNVVLARKVDTLNEQVQNLQRCNDNQREQLTEMRPQPEVKLPEFFKPGTAVYHLNPGTKAVTKAKVRAVFVPIAANAIHFPTEYALESSGSRVLSHYVFATPEAAFAATGAGK